MSYNITEFNVNDTSAFLCGKDITQDEYIHTEFAASCQSVSNELARLKANIISGNAKTGFGQTIHEGYYIDGNNRWFTVADPIKEYLSCFIIQVNPNDVIEITSRNAYDLCQYTFLKDFTKPVHQEYALLCDGYERIESNKYKFTVTAPYDAKYLYILDKYTLNIDIDISISTPSKIVINGTEMFKDQTFLNNKLFRENYIIINPNYYNPTSINSLEEAINAVPEDKRVGGAIIFFRLNETLVYKLYYNISKSVDNWSVLEYWKPIYTGYEIDNMLSTINDSIEYCNSISTGSENILKSISLSLNDTFYAQYNSTDKLSYTKLVKDYNIINTGDYIEIKARLTGGTTYKNMLNLISGPAMASRFGLYTNTQFWMRNRNTYIQWDEIPDMNDSQFHTYKVILTESGWELYIDGVSYGTRENPENFVCSYICYNQAENEPQNYDIQYLTVMSESVLYEFGNPAFICGSKNVLLNTTAHDENIVCQELYVEKQEDVITFYKHLTDFQYIAYPLRKRYKDYVEGTYPSYLDNYGILNPYIATFNGSSMLITTQLFRGGEAELAINTLKGDDSGYSYVGGNAHGFENIVTGETGREIQFLIDNQIVTEEQTFGLKPVSRIEVFQHTQLCKSYSNGEPFADVYKRWVITRDTNLAITTEVIPNQDIHFAQAQFGMMCVQRRLNGNESNPYLTNRAMKNNRPFVIYNVEDNWSNSDLTQEDPDCTQIIEYGECGLGFGLEIKDATLKEEGGMFIGTNNSTYNKIYFDLTGPYEAKAGESLKATQIWNIYGTYKQQ